MDITHILGPVDAVEARVTGTTKLELQDAICIQFPKGYEYPSGVFKPIYGLDPRSLIGNNVIVHFGRVRVGENGSSKEQTRIVRAYSLSGDIIGDHVPHGQEYEIRDIIRFE